MTNSSGTTQYINSYESFGIPDQGNSNRFGYTGQLFLSELELYYYKARIYHPKLGRFLQTDPVGCEDQMNLYAYVHNDPINLSDPTGMCSKDSSGSKVICDIEDKLIEIIEPIVEGAMKSAGVKVKPESERDPEGEFDHEATDNDLTQELTAIVVMVAKARTGGKWKLIGGKKNKRDQELKGKSKDFKRWFHRDWKQPGDRDSSNSEIQEAFDAWVKQGKPKG